MRATERIVPVVLAATGATVAVARLRALESLSPPDLAFFHQATWNAARGNGFVQTALEFDAGSLLGSIHLSLIRAVWVPFYAVLPAPETLVGLQGAALMGGTAAIGSRVIPRAGRPAIWMAVLALHPLTMALTTCDLRPLTFIVPAGMLVVAGLYSGRTLVVMAGVVGTALAREEAWLVLLAMVPFALMQARKAGHRRSLVALLGGVIEAWALPRGIWGHGDITANADPVVLCKHSLPERALVPLARRVDLRGTVSRSGLAGHSLPRAPRAGRRWLVSAHRLSNMEPAAPEHGGLHCSRCWHLCCSVQQLWAGHASAWRLRVRPLGLAALGSVGTARTFWPARSCSARRCGAYKPFKARRSAQVDGFGNYRVAY